MRDPLLFLSSLVAAVGCGPCLTAQKDQAEFFGLEKCWDVHLTVQAADLDKMYPKGSSRMGLSQGKGH